MMLLGRNRPRRGRPFRVLVLGGARSGKSVTAERMLAGHDRVDYVATGAVPDDADPAWAARVNAHRQRRPARWTTLETRDLAPVLTPSPPERIVAPVLVECLSTWLAGVMDDLGVWEGRDGADGELASRVDGLLDAWRATRRHVVAVSNEVGSGVVPATSSGVRYRDELGALNARIAAECEQAWYCVAGIPRRIK
ncbi:MAG: bifunctional adenosylcobinamide kinase/adenosylcobinamide-phosphate guanylyltransferase [Nocardiopsaceae bacterium]|nr:bifunctional adenosylcobinamide kinase/adenosylcobinamide-phosphate guanylyltransferase [Nocardiopsaceae bacterium]